MRLRSLAVLTAVPLVLTALPASAAPTVTVDRSPSSRLFTQAGGFGDIDDVAVGRDGTTYVLVDSEIGVYAPGRTGGDVPDDTFTVPDVADERAGLVTVDDAGYLTVISNRFGGGGSVRVLDPAGDVVATRDFADLGLEQPIAVTDVGDEVAIVDNNTNGVDVFDLYGADAADMPTRSIPGGETTKLVSPASVAANASGRIAVSGAFSSDGARVQWVAVFAPGANGDAVVPQRYFEGTTTGLQGYATGLALDADGGLYVGSSVLDGDNLRRARILRYAPSATGASARPLAVLGGSRSGLGDATYFHLLPGAALATFSYLYRNGTAILPDEVDRHRPLGPYLKPAKVRGLKVAGKIAHPQRRISWQAPVTNPDTPVERYYYEVSCSGGGQGFGRGGYLSAKTRSVTTKLGPLKRGRCTVLVQAVNVLGLGTPARAAFRVRR